MQIIDKELIDKINNSTYVSFDIFNTAILRGVLNPHDIFELVQRQYESVYHCSLTDYAQQRQKAEKKARKKAWQQRQIAEVKFDEIFECLQQDFGLNAHLAKTLQELEISAEIKLSRRNRYIFDLYCYCLKQKKKIIFISDMYLPSEAIDKILRSSGYKEFEQLFVSSEFGKTKSLGDLYQVVLDRLGCTPSQLLHIGDNYQSDLVMAKNNGLTTYYYESPMARALKDKLFQREKLSKIFSQNKSNSLHESVYLATVINKYYAQVHPKQKNNFWYDLGFKNLGILFLSFAGWLGEIINRDGIEKIFFLSRDGYIMKRVYDAIAQVYLDIPEADYLYASRRALNIPSIVEVNDVALNFLMGGTSTLTVSQFLARAGLEPEQYRLQLIQVGLNNLDEEIIAPWQYQKLKKFYKLIAKDIKKVASAERDELCKYLESMEFFDRQKIAIVDIGWQGTMQYSLAQVIKTLEKEVDIKGYYFATKAGAKKFKAKGMNMSGYLCDCGEPAYYNDTIRLSTEIFEFIHSAPHGSVIKFDSIVGESVPILEDNDRPKSELVKVRMMHQGALDFIAEYLKVLKQYPWLKIPAKNMAVAPLRRVLSEPTAEEAQKLGDIQHTESFGKIDRKRYIAKPPQYQPLDLLQVDKVLMSLKSSFWKKGYLKRLITENSITVKTLPPTTQSYRLLNDDMVIPPKVSVIVPAYNIRNYIPETLVSLEKQSFRDFEVLVVDDGSTDDTVEKIKPFCQRDFRFKLLQKENGGISSARNYGMRHARGEYIALLDGDDIYKPDKLANHVARLDRDPRVGVVYSASAAMRDDGGSTFVSLSGRPISSDPLLALLCKNFIGHGSNAVFRREIIEEVGGFDETLPSSEDIDFWLRIAATRRWQFDREPKILCCYRVRPSGVSFNVAEMQRCSERVIQAAYQRSPEIVEPMLPTAYAYMYRYLARLSITSGDCAKAKEYIDRAWESDASIFVRDPRSLVTLISVRLAPLAQLAIERSLGSVNSSSKPS